MNSTISPSSTYLANYSDEINEIFRTYLEDINPFIVQFEVLTNEFPIELQNEIRSMYGHLCRASIAEDEETVKRNIDKMRSHSKRALLDCYKYSSIVFLDEYESFFAQYEGIDLTYLNNGKFLGNIRRIQNEAKEALKEAKKAELSNYSDEILFDMYQTAYQRSALIHEELTKIDEDASYLKHKATRKDRMNLFFGIVGLVGTLFGIVGVVLTILG